MSAAHQAPDHPCRRKLEESRLAGLHSHFAPLRRRTAPSRTHPLACMYNACARRLSARHRTASQVCQGTVGRRRPAAAAALSLSVQPSAELIPFSARLAEMNDRSCFCPNPSRFGARRRSGLARHRRRVRCAAQSANAAVCSEGTEERACCMMCVACCMHVACLLHPRPPV